MEFFYIGTLALNYWMRKYFNKEWAPNNDIDISSPMGDIATLKEKYPNFDVVPIDFTEEYFFNTEGLYIQDGNEYYATPEYLLMTYYRRMRNRQYFYPKYMSDLNKIEYLKKIIQKRGFWEKTEQRLKEKIEFRAFCSENEYMYRIMRFINSDEIIGGEFALMCYYEMHRKIYKFNNMDLHIYNSVEDKIINRYGSRVIPHKETIPYIDYDGIKIQTIESLKKLYPELTIPDFLL